MKIVDFKTFIATPPGTVYAKYEPCVFDELCIKGNSLGEHDFCYQSIADAVDSNGSTEWFHFLDEGKASGTSIPMNFDCQGRDGLFDYDQLYAVFEATDVRALIERLERAVKDQGSIQQPPSS